MGRLVNQDRREAARKEREQHRSALSAAARQAFLTQPYASITLTGLAARAGVPEGTASMLLGTREELFYELFAETVIAWVPRFAAAVEAADRPLGVDAMAVVISTSVAADEALPRFAALLPFAVENAGADPAPLWRVATRLREPADTFQRLVADAGDERVAAGARTLPFYLLTLLAGLVPAARPVAGMATALADLDLSQYAVDLETELARLLAAVLR